jgi:hypothetical protein
MEYTEEDDDFNSWIDVVKENYPAIEITDEVLEMLSQTFNAGALAQAYHRPNDVPQSIIDELMH